MAFNSDKSCHMCAIYKRENLVLKKQLLKILRKGQENSDENNKRDRCDVTRVCDISLAPDVEVHAAVFEDTVCNKEKSKMCDVDSSDIEIPVTSKITDSCVDVDTLEEHLPDFDTLEDLIGEDLSQPLLNYRGRNYNKTNDIHSVISRSLAEHAENFDIVNMPVTLQDYNSISNSSVKVKDQVSTGSSMFDTAAVIYEETTDLKSTLDEIMVADHSAMIMFEQEGGGVATESEIQQTRCHTATTRTKKTKRKVKKTFNTKIQHLLSSPSGGKNIQTRSMARKISGCKYGIADEDGHTKGCNKIAVKPKPRSLSCIESDSEQRNITRSQIESTSGRKHSGYDDVTDKYRRNISQPKKKSESNNYQHILSLLNRDVCRIVSRAKNLRRGDQSLVDSQILKMNMKVEEMAAMPLKFDSPIGRDTESELISSAEKMKVSSDDKQTGIISLPCKNKTQTDIEDITENQTQQLLSMPLLDNYDIDNRITQEVCTRKIQTKECGTGTDVKSIEETQHQLSGMPIIDEITDSVGMMTSELDVTGVRLDEACAENQPETKGKRQKKGSSSALDIISDGKCISIKCSNMQELISSDERPQKKLSRTSNTRTGHSVKNVPADLEKHSLATNKQPHTDELLKGSYYDCDQFVPTELNVFDIAMGASVTGNDLLWTDLAISSSSDSESIPEETIGKDSNSTIISKMSDKTEYLCKEIKLNNKNLHRQSNKVEKNNEPHLVNKTELGDSGKSVCIDLLDSDAEDSVSVSTRNASGTGNFLCITSDKVSNVALSCIKKKKTVSLESSKNLREEEEEELNNIFNEFRCPSPVTPFTEKNITDCMRVQDTKETFRKFVRSPKIYHSENDSESDSNLQIDLNRSQAISDNDLSDSSTVYTVQSDGIYQGYEICKQKQVTSNTTPVGSDKSVNNKESSRLEATVEEEKMGKITEIVRVTKNVSLSPCKKLGTNKHILPEIVVRPGLAIHKKLKTYKRINSDTDDMKSLKMPRLSDSQHVIEQTVYIEKDKDCSRMGQNEFKMDIDNNQPSMIEVCQHSCTSVEIKQQSVSHDTNRASVKNSAVGKVSLLTQVDGIDSNQMVDPNVSAQQEIVRHFSFYNSGVFVAHEKVVPSDIGDMPLLKCSEESTNLCNKFKNVTEYLVPCDSSVLAKAYEFHRCDIYKPREIIKQETQKKQSDNKIAIEKAKLVYKELTNLVSSTEDELQTLITAFHSIKDHSKQAVTDGTVLVLLDEPLTDLSSYELRKQSLKKLVLSIPTVSRKKQLLLCLFNMFLKNQIFDNDICLHVGTCIKKELFFSKNLSIMSAASLLQFYTLLCRMVGDYWSMNALMYDILCGLKNRSHTLIFEILLMWPRILIPAWEIPTIQNNLVYRVMIHCIMNFTILRDSKLMRVVQLKMYLKVQYGYKLGEHTSEEMLQLLIDRLAENECKYALMLLFKRNKAEWNKKKFIPALQKAIEKSWNTNEAAALSAIWLLGIVCRFLPPSANSEIVRVFEFLKIYLFQMKGTPRLQEEIVIAFAHMHRLDKKSCVKILTQWKPKHGSVSVKVLKYMKPLICSHHPSLWNAYFSSIDEIDKELKKDQMDYFIQEEYDNAVNKILLKM